jgi:uncharacterized membrane protein (DUF4010 family)
MDSAVLGALSLALGLGLLIGLQREHARTELGGIRTFPLLALLGLICGLLADEWGAAVVVAGFLGVTSLAVLANLSRIRQKTDTGNQTTEAAALLTFALGAYLATDGYAEALVIGAIAAVLLQFKRPMHRFAHAIEEREIHAVMRFVIVSLIILPILPDQTYGPFQVLNPRQIWLMVVLIVGIGLAGYVSYKFFGERAGVLPGGILGGVVSSTATTVAYARRAKEAPDSAALAAITIMIASAVAVARVIVEVAVVAPGILAGVLPPLLAQLLLMAAVTGGMLHFHRQNGNVMPEQENPAELKTALIFAALYALAIFTTAAAKDHFGDEALYGVAVISGFVDVDAITLSSTQLAAAQRIDATTTWRVILIAVLVNLVFKAGVALSLGSAKLFWRLAVPIGLALAGGLLILLAWPAAPAH